MEESAPKRRRTSPRTSLNVSSAEAIPESSAPKPRRKRPSFASPTKASLARHNPEILERRRSRSPQKEQAARPVSRPESDAGSEQSLSELLTTQLESEAENLRPQGDPELFQDTVESSPSRGIKHARGGLAAAAKRSPSKAQSTTNTQRSQPPSIDTNDALNPFLGQSLRRSPPARIRSVDRNEAEAPRPPEPELPASVHNAPSPTPPEGRHASRSRWHYTAKDDSPLKQPPLRLPGKPQSAIRAAGGGVPRSRGPIQPLEKESSAVVRRTRSFDPDLSKKRERDALKEEIGRLKKDLEVVRKENERIRLMHQTGRTLAPSDPDAVLEILRRHHDDSDGSSLQPTATQQLFRAALNPGGLLPFGKPLIPMISQAEATEKLPELRSHYPILMTAQEELPYLELFSALTVISTTSILPPQPKQPVRQLHAITLRSREVPGIFTSRINMVVNAENLAILDLNVPSIEPAAKAELRPFVDKICTGDCNRSMQQNVGILCWAMGEWIRVAMERAAFWHGLEEKLSTEGAILDIVQRLRTRKSKRKKSEEVSTDVADSEKATQLKRADLLRLVGQQHYDIAIPDVDDLEMATTVRLQWKAEFDWTGEAKSKLGMMIGVPGKWHQLDGRGAIGSLPKLFDDLVKGGEKLETAVHTIVALAVGDR